MNLATTNLHATLRRIMRKTSSTKQSSQEVQFNVDRAIAAALERALLDSDQATIIEKLMQGIEKDREFRNALILLFIPDLFSPFAASHLKSRRTRSAKAEKKSSTKTVT